MKKPKAQSPKPWMAPEICKHGFPLFQTCYDCGRDMVGSKEKIERLSDEPVEYYRKRWEHWAEENNICRICGSERTVCGGEERHG